MADQCISAIRTARMTDSYQWSPKDPELGTTIMAVQFQGGVVLAADSRTSSGSFIANRVSDKLTFLHDKIFVCRSGSAADTQAIADMCRMYLSMHAISLGTNTPRVKEAAHLLNKLCYANKDNLMAGLIIAGWDPIDGASVYTIPLGGGIFKQEWSIGGSGSGYIFGFCDSNWRSGMTCDEALAFTKTAVSLAMSRDGSSGGVIRTVVITDAGVTRDMTTDLQLPHRP